MVSLKCQLYVEIHYARSHSVNSSIAKPKERIIKCMGCVKCDATLVCVHKGKGNAAVVTSVRWQ